MVRLWLPHPPHGFAVVPALVCLLVLTLAMLVRFDTPFGFTDATAVFRALPWKQESLDHLVCAQGGVTCPVCAHPITPEYLSQTI